MIRTCGVLLVGVLAAVFQVTYNFGWAYPFDNLEDDMPQDQDRVIDLSHSHQGRIPPECWSPPPKINIYECCPIPLLYPEEMIISCGIKKKPSTESGIYKPRTQRNCNESVCLMTKANLLFKNQSVDYEKLKVYIDQWAEANPNFTEAIMAAKPVCTRPPSIRSRFNKCDPDRIFLCLAGNILWNCNLKDYESCQILKNHIDECKPYYFQPKNPELLNRDNGF